MERIEFGELRIGNIARTHLMNVCDTNWASGGPKVKAFEKQWNDLFSYKKSVAMSSGTDGCMNACLSLYELQEARRGDEIIVPALSFIATSNAVRAAGFVPKFVDVKKETLNIDETKLEQAITNKTVAIMAVHTMGRPAEMKTICDIAKKYDLIVIEDACEAHGAKYKEKFVGQWGDMSVYSYYVAHIVSCGEGGMVSTNDDFTADVLRSTRSHGRLFNSVFFDHPRVGMNSKMNDMEASIGLEGISLFWDTFNRRKEIIKIFRDACVGFEDVAWFSEEDEGNVNCPHGFSITCKNKRDIKKVQVIMDKYKIHWKRNFGCIPTQHLSFADMGHSLGDFPASEWIGDNGLHIGCHQYLTKENINRICKAIRESLSLCAKEGKI